MTDQTQPHSSLSLPPTIRLNRWLSLSGVSARRKADELILAGRVSVNGVVIRRLGTQIRPLHDVVVVDGIKINREAERVVYLLHKPRGIVTTARDELARKSVLDIVPPQPRVFPVGRLDRQSEGLLILTNDGDLALKLTHPRYRHEKTYEAWTLVPKHYSMKHVLTELGRSRLLNGRHRSFERVSYSGRDSDGLRFRVVLTEGITHQVKRLFDRSGLTVTRLKRVAHGPFELGELQPGEWRRLDGGEIPPQLLNPKN